MSSEVGSAHVSIFPRMTGFRSAVAKESKSAGAAGAAGLGTGFKGAGTGVGRALGTEMKGAFSKAADSLGSAALGKLNQDVAAAANKLSTARLKILDGIGKVKVAQAQLTEAQAKYAADSSQVIRASERLATAARGLSTAQDAGKAASERLARAQDDLRVASERAAASGENVSSGFRRGLSGLGDVVSGVGGTVRSRFGEIFSGAFLANLAAGVVSRITDLIGDGIRAGVTAAQDAVQLASAFQQSTGAVEAVFKGSSSTIAGYALGAAKSVGLSANAYNELATVLGAQLKNGGTAIDEIAGKTSGLITLGADLSAQFGGSTSDAVSALSSALRGERDPIEKYGVSLTQSAIDAEAAALGYKKVDGALSTQAQQAATLALVYKQTTDAQGTFGRESDTLANRQQVLAAQLENVQTKIGTALLPIVTQFANFANDKLLPVLDAFADKAGPALAQAFEENQPQIEKLLDSVVQMLPQLTDLAVTAVPFFTNGLQALLPVLSFLITLTSDFQRNVGDVFGLLVGNTSIAKFAEDLRSAKNPLVQLNVSISESIANIKRFFDSAFTGGQAIVDGIVSGVRSRIDAAGKAINDVMKRIGEFLPHSPAKRGPFSGAGWADVAASGQAITQQVADGMASAKPDFGQALDSVARLAGARMQASVEAAAVLTSAAAPATSSAASAGAPAVYVQNPWTGEYLLAKARDVAADATASASQRFATSLSTGIQKSAL